jgi:hypothetical protein
MEFAFHDVEDGNETQRRRFVFMADDTSRQSAFITLLKEFRGHSFGLVVLEYDPSTIHFWARFFAEFDIEFSLYFPEEVAINWKQWAFVCAATARLVYSDDLLKWWRSNLIFDAEVTGDGQALFAHVCRQINSLLERQRFHQVGAGQENEPRLAIVSYYFSPVRSVAMQRLNYWAQETHRVSTDMGYPLVPHILTAVNHYAHPANVSVIRDFGDYLPYEGRFKDLHEGLTANNINTIGVSWHQLLLKTLSANPDAFKAAAVLLSGNPFFYFELGEWYKARFKSAVIYDFRDPFAKNPRIKYNRHQRLLLGDIERRMLQHADAVLAVNRTCLDLISQDDDVRYVEVANGYDERVVEAVKPQKRETDDKIRFIYTGTFYKDCSAEKFVKALEADRHEFHHYGLAQDDHPALLKSDAFVWHGPTPYPEVVSAAKSADVGLIFTGGKKFEQTTKIFDYIAADTDIVIVTEGEPQTGEIHNITKALDRVHWVENKSARIQAFLRNYRPESGARAAKTNFTRNAQTKILVDLIKEISSTPRPTRKAVTEQTRKTFSKPTKCKTITKTTTS